MNTPAIEEAIERLNKCGEEMRRPSLLDETLSETPREYHSEGAATVSIVELMGV